jgi:hypothetical protein
VSGGIADTLAAHQIRWLLDRAECRHEDCTRFYTGGRAGIERHHAAHQAEVLSSAGYGPLSALLDDLREMSARPWITPTDLLVLLARYAPSDPTPKEQQ